MTPPAPKNPLAITQALLAAGFTESDIAVAVAAAFSDIGAIDLAACLLDPSAYPATTRDGLAGLLTQVSRYSGAEVTAAVNVFFPPKPPPPVTTKIAAMATSTQGGSRGIELWTAGSDGMVWTLYQRRPGADWSSWEGPGFKGQPAPVRQLAAALQNDGNVEFFGLDDHGQVWGIGQRSPGGDWGSWNGPGLGGQPRAFKEIAASQQGGSRGVELWAAGDDGQVWTLYQLNAGGPWSRWEGPGFKGQPVPLRKLAAALQNNGSVRFWGLDESGLLWGISQSWPGGDWGGWEGPSFAGQPGPFLEIAASEQGGSRGGEIWGVGADGQIWTLYQTQPGGPWSRWEGPGFKGQPQVMTKLAAALQNNGNLALWAVDAGGALWLIGQNSPGGDWGSWSQPQMPRQ